MSATTLNEKIQAGFERAIALLKTVRDDLQGKVGTLSSLNTTAKSSLVAALNELKSDLASFSQINDSATGDTASWSAQKIQAQIDAAVTLLVNGAGADDNTLKELADRITALAQADTGLVSAAAAQTFTPAQKTQALANIGAAAAADLGDIAAADFVAAVNAAYNAA